MNRRDTIKKLATASGALISLPAWAVNWTARDFYSYQSKSLQQSDLLASVVDTIIPQGNGIGGLSVGVDKFIVKLLDKCYEPAVVENVARQLETLNASAVSSHSKSFPSCDQSQREVLLMRFANSESKDEKDFFNLIKSETIRGFNTSKEVMTRFLNYKMAPGHYYGSVDAKSS